LTRSGRFVCALSQLCGHGKIKKTMTKLTFIKDPGHDLSLFESGCQLEIVGLELKTRQWSCRNGLHPEFSVLSSAPSPWQSLALRRWDG
jgi:hypothetical protein